MSDEIIEQQTPEPIEELAPAPEPEPEPVSEPLWEWPSFQSAEPEPVQDPDPEPEVFQGIRQGAVQDAAGLMRNQAELRAQMTKAGASLEAIQMAEYTLLSMDPRAMVQPGAAKVAAAIATGTMVMQGRSWQQPKVTTPPPAQPVGNPNPSYTSPEVEQAKADFNKAFADLGITADLLNDED